MQLTARDVDTLKWINACGVVLVRHVARRWGIDFSTAARRMRCLADEGLLKPYDVRLMSVRPVVATAKGCAAAGETLPALTGVRLAELHHDLRLVDVAELLVRKYGGQFETARQLRWQRGREQPERHLPDGVLHLPDGQQIGIELELTPKSPRRLQAIIDSYGAELQFSQVWYLVEREDVWRLVKRLSKGHSHIRIARITHSGGANKDAQ
jgi:hypothetical protein